MGLADDLDQIEPNHRGRPTRTLVDRILAAYDGDDRAALEAAFANPNRYPSERLADFLTERGHSVSPATITEWRRRHGYR